VADYFQVAGYGGVTLFLGGYALLQLGKLRGDDYAYAVLNIVAACLVLISLMQDRNLTVAIILISSITLLVLSIARIWMKARSLRFTDEERAMIDSRFSAMRATDAKKLLKAGAWVDGQPGDTLTEQGAPVTRLTYIISGGVDILIGDQTIAQVGPDEFIGEMACISDGPASATVRVNQPSRYFCVPSEALRRLVRSNPDFGAHLDLAFAANLRSKLMATNARLEQAIKAKSARPDQD
jgi:CRP-like cAMP-binding protein